MTREERNRFVEDNLKFVHHLLKPYNRLPNYEDYYMQGVLGMIDALDNMEGEINKSYIGSYVTGYVKRYINRIDVPVTPISNRRGTYERVDCCSLNCSLGDDTSDTFEDVLADANDAIDDAITYADFKAAMDKTNVRNKKPFEFLLKGYNRTDAAKMSGISRQRVDQMCAMLDRSVVA